MTPLISIGWRARAGVLSRSLSDGGLFLVEPVSGRYLTLNYTAARFFAVVCELADHDAAVGRLAAEFAVDAALIGPDLSAVASALVAEGFLEEIPSCT